MKLASARIFVAGLLSAPAMLAAAADAPRRFAAPELASAPAGSGAVGIGQVFLALIFVLVVVFAAALVMKRLRGFTAGGAGSIEVLAQTSVGAKERVVIVRVAGSRLLLGVASGQVSLLQTLPPDAEPLAPVPAPTQPQPPGFADLLRRSLGR